MKQAIAGMTPSQTEEVTVAVVWPSVCSFALARWLGRQYARSWPDVYFFRIGNLLALLSIPLALALYFLRLAPRIGKLPCYGQWYKLTNRRVVVLNNTLQYATVRLIGIPLPGFRFDFGAESHAIELSEFDDIQLESQDGYEWFNATDMVLTQSGREAMRLPAVPRAEGHRATFLKSRVSHVGVAEALRNQTDVA